MREAIIAIIGTMLCMLALAGCTGTNRSGPGAGAAQTTAAASARRVSVRFGEQLKYVDILAPTDLVRQAMRKHYAGLVTGELLQAWLANPRSAPGKTVSSPWPESIAIERVRCSSARRCEVKGYVRYVTSVEMTQGGAFWRRRITLDLRHEGQGWRIAQRL